VILRPVMTIPATAGSLEPEVLRWRRPLRRQAPCEQRAATFELTRLQELKGVHSGHAVGPTIGIRLQGTAGEPDPALGVEDGEVLFGAFDQGLEKMLIEHRQRGRLAASHEGLHNAEASTGHPNFLSLPRKWKTHFHHSAGP